MPTLEDLRSEFHDKLADGVLGWRNGKLNIADSSSPTSTGIAKKMAEELGRKYSTVTKQGQTLGTEFGEITKNFLDSAFARLHHLRPGEWLFTTSQSSEGIGVYEQYEHLVVVQKIFNENPDLKSALGGDYLVTPDILVGRRRLADDQINSEDSYVGEKSAVARLTPLRQSNPPSSPLILHASISCKWSIRSDRVQNTRTEALNLIRNRKGNTPHIMFVTFEPLPSRIASIAMGTGDVDCTYHAALPELKAAVDELERDVQSEALANLIDGRRLRDISDLPLDLAV